MYMCCVCIYVCNCVCVFYVYVGVHTYVWLLFDCSPPYTLMQRFWLNSELIFGQSSKLIVWGFRLCFSHAQITYGLPSLAGPCMGAEDPNPVLFFFCLASPLPLSHLHRTLNIFLNFNLFEEWVISIYKGQSAATYNCLFYIKVHNTENTKCSKIGRGDIFLVRREWLLRSWAFAGWFMIYLINLTTHSFKKSMSVSQIFLGETIMDLYDSTLISLGMNSQYSRSKKSA